MSQFSQRGNALCWLENPSSSQPKTLMAPQTTQKRQTAHPSWHGWEEMAICLRLSQFSRIATVHGRMRQPRRSDVHSAHGHLVGVPMQPYPPGTSRDIAAVKLWRCQPIRNSSPSLWQSYRVRRPAYRPASSSPTTIHMRLTWVMLLLLGALLAPAACHPSPTRV